MGKKQDDNCKCKYPKVKIHYDDRGRAVRYCDRCWTTIAEGKDKNNE